MAFDHYSFSSLPIEMFFGSTRLSSGTAFVWRDARGHSLVTNWHNVTGKDPTTGEHLSRTAAEPDRIKIYFNTKGRLGEKLSTTLLLRDDADKPIWCVHPTFKQAVDIVAIPLMLSDKPEWFAINTFPQEPLAVEIGHDVFILGFPFGIGPLGLPIWKRGSLASEPSLAQHNKNIVFIDTASRPGMSGSPIIRRSWGNHSYENGATSMGPGSATRFVGIYSGRLNTADPLDAQLGISWPAFLVEEVIMGGTRAL